MEKLTDALKARDDADAEIVRILKRDYPPGASIRWEYNGRTLTGLVISSGFTDRIKVHNSQSRKEYWIYAYRIVGVEPPTGKSL